ncbi:HNH endonuclease [Corynebacterium diphtheriae]
MSRMPEHVAEAVISRSRGACEAMNSQSCTGLGQPLHHRRMRSQGGSHEVTNLIYVCSGCHQWIHGHPKESYKAGWLVRSVHDPSSTPVQYRNRQADLLEDGGVKIWQN